MSLHRCYMPVNGLNMYFEEHGAAGGGPLVLLHGGLSTIQASFAAVLPTFAKTRRIVAIEQQGHGHTADTDRPLTFEQMGDDTATLLQQLGIENADFLGYSDGGNVALSVVINCPRLVRKLVLVGVNFTNDGLTPAFLEFLRTATPEDFGEELREAHAKVAPRPDEWPTLVAKVTKMNTDFKGWKQEQVRAISAPTLIVIGDRDIVRPEHAIAASSLLRHSQIAILPGTHHESLMMRHEWLVLMITSFLDRSSDRDSQA